MSRWFRMYNEALDDPKVQSLNGNDFKGWVNILLLACRHEGILPPLDDIAFALRINSNAASKLMKKLEGHGLIELIDTDDAYGKPHGWDKRQFKSDESTDRVKRFRNGKRNVSSGVTVTAPEAETETDTEAETETDSYPSQDSSCILYPREAENSVAPFRAVNGGAA